MFPILLQIEPITIYSLWIMLGIGFFASLILINNLVKYRKVKLSFLADNSIVIFFSGLILSRLVFVISNWQYFFADFSFQTMFSFFYIWDKGLSPWGAIAGVYLALYFICKKKNSNFGAWADIFTASIIFAVFFAHLGAFLDGRNYGIPTNLPWGIMIDTSRYAIPIHPTQIYAAIYSLIIGITGLALFNNEKFKENGLVSLLIVNVYSIFRFIEEFLRGDETIRLLGLRLPYLLALITFGISGFLLYKYLKQLKI